jgi:hypothetical protein
MRSRCLQPAPLPRLRRPHVLRRADAASDDQRFPFTCHRHGQHDRRAQLNTSASALAAPGATALLIRGQNVCRCDRFHVSPFIRLPGSCRVLPLRPCVIICCAARVRFCAQGDIRALSKILPMHPGVCRIRFWRAMTQEEALANASRPDADCARDRCHICSSCCDWVTVAPSKRR